eukprot:1500254-Rhodomonas_salina.1
MHVTEIYKVTCRKATTVLPTRFAPPHPPLHASANSNALSRAPRTLRTSSGFDFAQQGMVLRRSRYWRSVWCNAIKFSQVVLSGTERWVCLYQLSRRIRSDLHHLSLQLATPNVSARINSLSPRPPYNLYRCSSLIPRFPPSLPRAPYYALGLG